MEEIAREDKRIFYNDILAGNSDFLKIKNVYNANIMGQPYKIKIVSDKNDLVDFAGLTRTKEKDILILDNYEHIEKFKQTLIHELLHAFFDECGLPYYCNDERLIYWLEKNYFKILTTFNSVISQVFKK